jgi:hypothetical protein
MNSESSNNNIRQCTSIEEVTKQVFSVPPAPPKTHVLDPDQQLDMHSLFENLGYMLTHGCEFLFGPVSVSDLSVENVALLQQYMQSFGWEFILNPDRTKQYSMILPWELQLPLHRGQGHGSGEKVTLVFQYMS